MRGEQDVRQGLKDLFIGLIDIQVDKLADRFPNVISVGLDVCQVPLVEKILAHGYEPFSRILRPEESVYCQQFGRRRAQHIAGFFAAKEAVYKMLKSTPGGSWYEIVIDHDDDGAPVVRLEGKVKERADELGITNILLSITQDETVGVALCIGVRDNPKISSESS